jgi:ketosteroid isomerase-like protein
MPDNTQTIQAFYSSFKNLDAEGMKNCYHPDIHFSDPVFPTLNGKEVGAMWAMLIENLKRGKGGWQLKFNNIRVSESEGSAHWEANYIFSATGRPVHNKIKASFQFKDGLIIRHIDEFNFYRWARMAFGIAGILLGWTPFFKAKVQSRVKDLLVRYLSAH